MSDRRITLSEDDFNDESSVARTSVRFPEPLSERRPSSRPRWPKPSGTWLATILAATVVAAGGVTVVVVKTAQSKSAPDFCAVLKDHSERIRSNIPDTQHDPGLREFAQALGNVGRFQTMLDDLADAAPSEIKSDMATTRDTFKHSIDTTPGSLRDVPFVIAGNISRTVIHSSSFENVDAYAEQHCGQTIFGSPSGAS